MSSEHICTVSEKNPHAELDSGQTCGSVIQAPLTAPPFASCKLQELIRKYPPDLSDPVEACAQSGGGQSAEAWLEDSAKSKHQLEETLEATTDTNITTLMICDIPCRQSVEQICEVINQQGFANAYNLVYMPSKRPKYMQNMGYAFVNFKTAEQASAFAEVFKNFPFPNCSSRKLSYTKPARHQGYEENLNRYTKQRAVGCLVTDEKEDVVFHQAASWRPIMP